jgi:hypothetical protein
MDEGDDMSIVDRKSTSPGTLWYEDQLGVKRDEASSKRVKHTDEKGVRVEERLTNIFDHMETLTDEDRRLKGELVKRGLKLTPDAALSLPVEARSFLCVNKKNVTDVSVTAFLHQVDNGITFGVNGRRVSYGLGDKASIIAHAEEYVNGKWSNVSETAGLDSSYEALESSLGAAVSSIRASSNSRSGAA